MFIKLDNDHLIHQECINAAMAQQEPSVLYRPRIFRDGDMWCCLLGDDLQVGVVGFGESPSKAVQDFNRAWYKDLETEKSKPTLIGLRYLTLSSF